MELSIQNLKSTSLVNKTYNFHFCISSFINIKVISKNIKKLPLLQTVYTINIYFSSINISFLFSLVFSSSYFDVHGSSRPLEVGESSVSSMVHFLWTTDRLLEHYSSVRRILILHISQVTMVTTCNCFARAKSLVSVKIKTNIHIGPIINFCPRNE